MKGKDQLSLMKKYFLFIFYIKHWKIFYLISDLDDSADASDTMPNGDTTDKTSTQTHHFSSQVLNGEAPSVSSIETLLLNIQGLLKVAAENARHHERQINFEKGRQILLKSFVFMK